MKPRIFKVKNFYWCCLPIGLKDVGSPPTGSSCACGLGFIPIEAYNQWLKSRDSWEKYCDQV